MDLEDLVLSRYPTPEWVTVIEVRAQTGYGPGADQRYDAVALNCYPSKDHLRAVFEVKKTRGDFMRELDNPKKRKQAEKFFHETWFVTTPGVCVPEEVPEGWGLLVSTKSGKSLRRKRAAMQRIPKPPPWGLALSILRQQQGALEYANKTLENNISAKFQGKEVSEEFLKRLAYTHLEAEREVLDIAKKKVLDKHRELNTEINALKEPLVQLGRISRGYGIHSQSPISRDQVDEMVDAAVAKKLEAMTKQVLDAHKTLERLIEGMKL